MKKFLLSFLLATSVFAQGDPPPYVKGQSASGLGNLGSTIQVPKNQSTKLNSYQARIETGNPNELRNPSFEGSPYNSGWTCPTGTISQAVGPDGFKALGIVSSGAGFECNQTFTSTADLKGTLARFFARVKTSAPNTFVCGLDGGSAPANRVNCQKVSLTSAEKVFSETSGFFNYGNMVYGIAIYSTDTAAFPTVIDEVSMGAAGLTTATIQGDTVYTAKVSSTGVVSDENVDFINGNCVMSGTNSAIGTCSFKAGIFTQPPNCTVSAVTGSATTANIHTQATTSGFAYYGFNTTNATNTATTVNIACFKQGADYANSSSSGILSSNANTGEVPCTFSTTNWGGFGTVPTGNLALNCRRDGERLVINGYFIPGTPTGSTAFMPMPTNFGTILNRGVPLNSPRGSYFRGTSSTIHGGPVMIPSSSTSEIHFGCADTFGAIATNPIASCGGTGVAVATEPISIVNLTIPIAGWTQSPLAIIPLYTPLVHARAFAGSNVSVTNAVTPMVNIAEDATGIFSNAATLITATIKQAGLYNICFYASTNVANNIGIVISGELYQFDTYATNARGSGCWVQRLAIGETVRPYLPASGTMYGGVDDNGFSVTRIGD